MGDVRFSCIPQIFHSCVGARSSGVCLESRRHCLKVMIVVAGSSIDHLACGKAFARAGARV